MSTYNSYAEAKIANPEGDIYAAKMSIDGRKEIFGLLHSIESITSNYYECDPANYCITVEKFLADGHKFVEGDLLLGIFGDLITVGNEYTATGANKKVKSDNRRYILRAAALLKPQFQIGDTVYDDDGIEYRYVSVHPLLPETSVLLNSLGELTAIRTNKLTTKPPVTPKEGEWWMCELTEENLEITQVFNNVLRFSSDWEITGYPKNKIKPLYHMIRDTDSE